MNQLGDFAGCVVALHSYNYSPIATSAGHGGRYGEVRGMLVVLTGIHAGEEMPVYTANRLPVVAVKTQLLGNFDGPMYGRVSWDNFGGLHFDPLDSFEEAIYRSVVNIEPDDNPKPE